MTGVPITALQQPSWIKKAAYVSKADVDFLYRENHVNRAYEQRGIKLRQGGGSAVLDIGANIGMFATRAAEAVGSNGRVIAAEPIPATYQALEQNILLHKEYCDSQGISCAPIIPLNVGIGNGSTSTATFTFYPQAAGWGTLTEFDSPNQILEDMDRFIDNALEDENSTALSPTQRALGTTLKKLSPELYRSVARASVKRMMSGSRQVECRMATVSQIITEQGIERVHLLKIDCERAELEILKGIQTEHWGIIDQAALEVHAENLEKVLELLRRFGQYSTIETMQTNDLQKTSIYMVFAHRN